MSRWGDEDFKKCPLTQQHRDIKSLDLMTPNTDRRYASLTSDILDARKVFLLSVILKAEYKIEDIITYESA
jgi:hypothetical protein